MHEHNKRQFIPMITREDAPNPRLDARNYRCLKCGEWMRTEREIYTPYATHHPWMAGLGDVRLCDGEVAYQVPDDPNDQRPYPRCTERHLFSTMPVHYDPLQCWLEDDGHRDHWADFAGEYRWWQTCRAPEVPPPKVEVLDLVLADLRARGELGRKRYGKPLFAENDDVDGLRETYEEILDAAQYLGTVQEGRQVREREIYAATFGRVVHRIRQSNGLTQADVAVRTKFSQAKISKIEAGLAVIDVFDLPILALAMGGYTGTYLLVEADRARLKVERVAAKINAKHAWKRTARPLMIAIVRMAVDA